MANLPLIEGCVDSLVSARAACAGGADRLELCANLVIGGTTPSRALFAQVKAACPVKLHVLIRPRFGDFLYDEPELAQMEADIAAFRALGADGVVFGVLTADGGLDVPAMSRLMAAAGGMNVTLHRAFDVCRDPFEALEAAISLGCGTVLTSGQAADALSGADVLAALFQKASGRVDIMAGSGVRAETIPALYQKTGVRVYHTTGRCGAVDSPMRYRKPGVPMGLPLLSEYDRWYTDPAEFAACTRIVHALP